MSWDFKREEPKVDDIISEGPHRVRIKKAEKAVSKAGNDMLKLILEVQGYESELYHYIVFMPDKPQLTNRLLTQFFDSFADIPEGQFDTSTWSGARGAAMIKHDTYNGYPSPKVHWFIHRDKQADLPDFADVSENTPAPKYETEEMPAESNEPETVPETGAGGIPVTLLPDGSIKLPNGQVVKVAVQEEQSFDPDGSWQQSMAQNGLL